VCLRKLGALIGGTWDVETHYRGLFAWAKHEGLTEEATWYNERLQVITGSFCEEELQSQHGGPTGMGSKGRGGRGKDNQGDAKANPQSAAHPRLLDKVAGVVDDNDGLRVVLSGRCGTMSSLNGTYFPAGCCNGRRAFRAEANGGRSLFLYYLRASDSWAIGRQLGDEAVYADCGPTGNHNLGQIWRVWDGSNWMDDPKMQASTIWA